MRESPIYEQLWTEAAFAFKRGEPQVDPHLREKKNDLRRGVTLLFRPSRTVRDKVKEHVDQLAGVFPNQYFYRPNEFHVTVHSIISGSEFWRREIRQLTVYRAIINEVLRRQHSFKVNFRGVTASSSCVMVQGFSMDDSLSRIRDELRAAFARNGFADVLDHRYRISTAHMTIMRFSDPAADWKRLASLLEKNREIEFGEMDVGQIELVWGDWYASADVERVIQEYNLTPSN